MKILLFILFSIFYLGECKTGKSSVASDNSSSSDYDTCTPTSDGIGKIYMGREISRVMGAAGAEWLERKERDKEENTKLAIEKMLLSADDIVADIGAGTGYYTFEISRKIPLGKVYAIELQDELIGYLNERKRSLGAKNVEVVKGSKWSLNLPDNSVDLAIMIDVYHELEYPREILLDVKKSLKAQGKLLLLEYRAEDPSIQIKQLHKMTVTQVNKELQANGFKLFYKGDFLPIQHFLLYEKK